MKVLNIGSMNFDHVYKVDHIVQPGETEDTIEKNLFLGGKGMNQSVALAKAGAEVSHAGLVGPDGKPFLDTAREHGVDAASIETIEEPTGHAIIQIDANGQNCILLYPGANNRLTEAFVDRTLDRFDKGDILLLQNEVNQIPYIVDKAHDKGMLIALNPSPYNEKLDVVDLSKIGLFLLNEVEGFQMTGKKEPDEILEVLQESYPDARIVLTLGKDGAVYKDKENRYIQPIFPVEAVDTTAAGDTFTGYFLAGYSQGMPVPEALELAAKASSIAVTRPGAVPSIPEREEVEKQLH